MKMKTRESDWFEFVFGFEFVVSGFDAHEDDPLAGLELTDQDYEWVTAAALDVRALSI